MAELIAIGYPDEETADLAAEEVLRLAQELVIEPDAVAVIKRDQSGKFHVKTFHHEVATGATWGMFWGLLFGVLFFVPVLGIAVGALMGAMMGHVAKLGISEEFKNQVREHMQPGTSALFMVLEKMTADKTMEALSKFGGSVIKSSLSKEAEQELQEALHGPGAAASA